MSYAYTPTNEEIWAILDRMQPDENGVYPPDIDWLENRLSEMLTEQYDGFTDICRYYKDMEAQSEAIDNETARLAEKKAKLKERMGKVMEFLQDQLGEENHTFGPFNWQTRKTAPVLTYYDGFNEKQLIEWCKDNRPELVATKVTENLDKAAAKEACKKSELPMGVALVAGRSYKIK